MKIDGREIAAQILKELKTKVDKLKKKQIVPTLAIILVGNDPASITYVGQKEKKAQSIGVKTVIKHFSAKISELKLMQTIQQLNEDNHIHGIIIQQPLPSHINTKTITLAVNPKKDIDGFNPKSKFQPPIAQAVMEILEYIYNITGDASRGAPSGGPRLVRRAGNAWGWRAAGPVIIWLKTKKIVVIGKGETGGKPIINALQKLGVEPLIIDTKTENPENIIKKADILISAAGKHNLVKSEMIKKGSILISIGLFKGLDGKLHGDYEEKDIENIASFYTPIPGGVGPVNVACLLENLIIATKSTNQSLTTIFTSVKV